MRIAMITTKAAAALPAQGFPVCNHPNTVMQNTIVPITPTKIGFSKSRLFIMQFQK
jgi:hypothetical protein